MMKIRGKLTDRRFYGRFQEKSTGRKVNVHKARNSGGWSVYFYYYRQSRYMIPENELSNDWFRIGALQ